MKTGRNNKTQIHKQKKKLQRVGDHGVNAIGSSVQNGEGIDFFKVLCSDVVSGPSLWWAG